VLSGGAERKLVGHPGQWVIRADDPRTLSTRGASAYVKLAEGCNRSCSFCIIPKLRGKQRSRNPDDVVREVERLCAAGVKEINLVSQDTVAYGRDLAGSPSLAKLVERIAEVSDLHWLRLFYLYPETLDSKLVELLAQHPRVLPYVDMPLQHASDGMLRRMRRGHGGQRLRQVVERLRSAVDDLVFRTAFIVGHPGETQAEFDELLDFVQWAEFDRVGVFRYSDEDRSRSFSLDGKVPRKTQDARLRRLMSAQRKISKRKNAALVGRQLEVLVEGPSEQSELVMVGRHRGQAPEIDGVVYLSGGEARPGQMRTVQVVQATDYDLVGELSDPTFDDGATSTPKPMPTRLLHRSSDGRSVLRTIS
jgi:ribosomal protein S12 methylthiotransferase